MKPAIAARLPAKDASDARPSLPAGQRYIDETWTDDGTVNYAAIMQ
jgi:hypothetical protein